MEKSEFAKDFNEFFEEIRSRVDATVEQATTLYAIYRKDLRANRLNKESNTDNDMATAKQKGYLLDLAEEKGMRLTQSDVDKMTKEEASRTINALLGGD